MRFLEQVKSISDTLRQDPAGRRDPQGLRAARLRPARRDAARHRPGGEGEPGRALPRLPLGLRHRRRPGARTAGDENVDSNTNTVDALIKSLRENHYDATQVPQEGQEVRQRAQRLRRARLGLAQRDERPRRGRPPARQADHPRRAEADRLGHRQPLVRLAAAGDRRAAPVRVHRRGQGALRAALRARGRRQRPDPQGAEARSGRSATGSSAATPLAPTRSTPTPSATRSTATTSTSCARRATCAATRARQRESAPLASHLSPGARTRREVMKGLKESPWSP